MSVRTPAPGEGAPPGSTPESSITVSRSVSDRPHPPRLLCRAEKADSIRYVRRVVTVVAAGGTHEQPADAGFPARCCRTRGAEPGTGGLRPGVVRRGHGGKDG